MSQREALFELKKLVEGLSDVEMRELCITALRSWWGKRPSRHEWADPVERPSQFTFKMHEHLGRELVPLLASRQGSLVRDLEQLIFPFTDSRHYEWMTGVAEFVWWFIAAGFGVESDGYPPNKNDGHPNTIRLTRAGTRFLEHGEDHPALPGFMDRMRSRCPGMPDGVFVLIGDARACFDHALLRPAVVLMGVAYELAIEAVVDVLATKGLVGSNTVKQTAAPRIAAVRAALEGSSMKQALAVDARTAALAAYDFADTLRLRRNAAAHTTPAHGFDDRQEIEEFLVSASRHLPAIWSLAT